MGGQLAAAARRGVDIFRRDGFGVLRSGAELSLASDAAGGDRACAADRPPPAGEAPYETWIRIFDEEPERDRARHEERLATLRRRPLISILAVLTSAEPSALVRLARSATGQIYPAWELLVAAPQAEHGAICEKLVTHGLDCGRLRLVNAGADDVESLNALLAVAQGDHILPLAEGALLRPHALLEFAITLAQHPAVELIYADEDVMGSDGQRRRLALQAGLVADHAAERLTTSVSRCSCEFDRARARRLARRNGRSTSSRFRAAPRRCGRLAHDRAPRQAIASWRDGVRAGRSHSAAPASTAANTSTARLAHHPDARRRGRAARPASVRSASLTRYPDYEIIIVDNGSVQDETKRLFAELSCRSGDPHPAAAGAVQFFGA